MGRARTATRRAATAVTATALAGLLAGAASYGATAWLAGAPAAAGGSPSAAGSSTSAPVATPTSRPTATSAPAPTPTATPTPTRTAEPTPTAGPPMLREGDSSDDVRELQARLAQIRWFSERPTGYYGRVTAEAVRGFQAKRQIPVTGSVDRTTMDRLQAMTVEPTREQLYPPEPTTEPGALDPRCAVGRVLCIDKSTTTLRWVVDGSVRRTLAVRFGSEFTPTREGTFSVYVKSRDHVSSLYGSSMPFAMFFSGGQAVHYSPDFAARGYNGASHGCVNTRDYEGTAALFDEVSVGDRVVVYRS